MLLVGVTGGVEEVNGVRFAVKPSEGLVSLIHSHAGMRIGVDLPPALVTSELDVLDIRTAKDDMYYVAEEAVAYWRTVLQACKASGAQPIFLRDNKLDLSYRRKIDELEEARESLDMLMSDGYRNRLDRSHIQNGKQQLEQRIFYLESITNHMRAVRDSDALLLKLGREKPDIALIDESDADYFMNRLDLLSNQGITVDSYLYDYVDLNGNHEVNEATAVLARVTNCSEATPLARENIERAYNAVKRGRIKPDGSPNFIGTTDLYIPQRGMCEIYVEIREGDDFLGTMHDINGVSDIKGKISSTRLSFVQRYSKRAVMGGALDTPIIHQADLTGSTRGFFVYREHGPHDSYRETMGNFAITQIQS